MVQIILTDCNGPDNVTLDVPRTLLSLSTHRRVSVPHMTPAMLNSPFPAVVALPTMEPLESSSCIVIPASGLPI